MHRLARLGVQLECSPKSGVMIQHSSETSLDIDVNVKKYLDYILMELKESIL